MHCNGMYIHHAIVCKRGREEMGEEKKKTRKGKEICVCMLHFKWPVTFKTQRSLSETLPSITWPDLHTCAIPRLPQSALFIILILVN